MFQKLMRSGLWAGMLLLPARVLAQDYGAGETAGELGYNKSQNIYALIASVTGFVLSFVAIVFFAMMMYAGLRWMTARGNEELAEKAKHTLQAATIGFVIVVLSYALTRYIFGALGYS